MNFPVALIFLMLSTVPILVHSNGQCKTTSSCNCHLNNFDLLEQFVDVKIKAALANIPGILLLNLTIAIYMIVL